MDGGGDVRDDYEAQQIAPCLFATSYLPTYLVDCENKIMSLFFLTRNKLFFLCFVCRYGSELVEVESWSSHNWTLALAKRFSHGDPNFWLGFNTLDDLRTNTLDSASGSLLSQYAGTYIHLAKLIDDVSGKILLM